jgi:hypothetical protein
MYWARLADIPDGMRAQLWLDTDGVRVRGAYTAMPFNGELEGRMQGDGVELTFYERGITRMVGSRTRTVVLHWADAGDALSGRDSAGDTIELVRTGFVPPGLRPGLWLSRWTGLPFGISVETRLTQSPDGHWRAMYQYQGSGGVREGSFDGEVAASGVMDIRWQEISESGLVARGRGRLSPNAFGFRGTFGIEGSNEETGEWVIEPFAP